MQTTNNTMFIGLVYNSVSIPENESSSFWLSDDSTFTGSAILQHKSSEVDYACALTGA